jgi:hypothetical protein
MPVSWNLYVCFELDDDEFRREILSTVRYLVDSPKAQECAELISFFGDRLHGMLTNVIEEKTKMSIPVFKLLLDALSILSMQRHMQDILARNSIYDKLYKIMQGQIAEMYTSNPESEKRKIELSILRTLAQVAMHPCHRLTWMSKADTEGNYQNAMYPPRDKFKDYLQQKLKEGESENEEVRTAKKNLQTIGSLLLAAFEEQKFLKEASEIETTFRSILDWWRVNTTARYEEEIDAQNAVESGIARQNAETITQKPLADLLAHAIQMKVQDKVPTSRDTMRYCAPHECIIVLSLFSRLALEPKFKQFFRSDVLQALLGCVCVGIWPEAREAAATLANLMWLPDQNEERLVCWLKFDGPKCITVDAANVLMPVKSEVGNGRIQGAEMGKGMYKSTWGVQFGEGTCVTLHPDGLKTHELPGLLTSASPFDTFANLSQRPYEGLDREAAHPRHFTITCWFYWPVRTTKGQSVLVQSKDRSSQIYLEIGEDEDDSTGLKAKWNLEVLHELPGSNAQRTRCPLKTPQLSPGWHMLSLVSSTSENKTDYLRFDGTKFFLDEWHCMLQHAWVKNDFHIVGNDMGSGARKPFGLMCDFRIYARALPDDEIKTMVKSKDTEAHPDRIARMLASMNAATILAQRLDVPDSAAECLRALGSLATLQSQRAKIFSVCGREILRMLDSPLPMIQRQAARLVSNIT